MNVNIRQYFSPAAIGVHLAQLPKISTFIMDLIYGYRITHPLPVLGIEELVAINGNVPVVRRGTAAYPLAGDSTGLTYLEPQPVDVSSFLGASELNNLKLLGDKGIQYWVRSKVDSQRRVIRATTEALACQSLTGKISYAMKTDSGLVPYEINFGSILSYTIAKKWDAAETTVADILMDLIAMGTVIQNKSGYGSQVAYLAGKKTYVNLANKVLGLDGESKVKAEVTEKGISIAGFTVMLASGGYKDLLDGDTYVPAVADHHIQAVALDAPWKLFYCALDDLDANLLPMPFYSKPIKKENPSGYDIIGMSKPVPVPAVNGTCRAVATAA